MVLANLIDLLHATEAALISDGPNLEHTAVELKSKTIAASVSSRDEWRDNGSISKHLVKGFLVDRLTGYAVFAVSSEGLVLSWNAGAQSTFGYEHSEIIGQPLEILFTREEALAGEPTAELYAALSGARTQHDRWHVRKDGTRFWGLNTVEPMFDETRALQGFIKLVRDVTQAHAASQATADSEQRLRMLIESVGETAIFTLDLDGTIRSWNAGAEGIFGYVRDDIMGRPLATLFSADDARAGYAGAELEKAASGGTTNVERWLQRSNGSRFFAGGKLSQLKLGADTEPRGFVTVLHDITAQHAVAEDLRRRTQFDELTDLPNRRSFNEHLHRAIGLMRRRASTVFAVLFIDLDRFKSVNDQYGHRVADKLLAVTARRLEHCVRSGDVVARLGGDEFAILLNAINGLDDATDAAARIAELMRQPVEIDGVDVCATVSTGIAVGDPAYERPDDILRDADAAMNAAKLDGRARTAVFNTHTREHPTDWAESLRRAIDRDELRVAYQPIVHLRTGRVAGFEALVRWDHPRRGLLLPNEFIRQAEECELILAIDRWILTEACRQLATWRASGLDALLTMSVNVSGREFSRSNFFAGLRQILDSTGIPAGNLRIEITESVILEQSERARAILAAIRGLGICLDIDDFGTGFSSLGTLQHVEVDALKIDSSFVARIDAQIGATLVETVISLARKLDIEVIAEGIERPEQARRLEALGCSFGQGALFAAPLPAEPARRFADQRVRSRIKPRGAS
jgi:diguanylate cyclase (GGDEF)-like protein/PAS domain S-box-containing protein